MMGRTFMIPLQLTLNHLYVAGVLLRVGFFFFGLYQDKNFSVKYTDIDYLVFSDAARYVYQGLSPYNRETYRYTPLLAWILIPNSWGGVFVHYGKILFIACDILTGYLIVQTLSRSNQKLSKKKILVLSSLWLLNPMVITISTRGSSESFLTFIIMLSLQTYLSGHHNQSAFWLGLSIHFKIYPIIYLPAFMYSMAKEGQPFHLFKRMYLLKWLNRTNCQFLLVALLSFIGCTAIMFQEYGYEFLNHTYIYHLSRLDHRHNFSLYNVMLYYKSASTHLPSLHDGIISKIWVRLTENIEKIAFLPQLLLSAVIIPLLLAQDDLATCFFVQTFAFVTFNKVMTSQYFIWFLIFLPHYLARSRLFSSTHWARSLILLLLWLVSQALWLFFAYKLEFLGQSTFACGLLLSSALFYLTNCWVLGNSIQLS